MINDLFSRGILLGLGAAITGKEKLEDSIMKMVEQGMMSKGEADSMFNGFMKKGAETSENWNKELRSSITKQLKDLGFVTKEEVDTLQAQIVLLQQEIANLRQNKSEGSGGVIEPGTVAGSTSDITSTSLGVIDPVNDQAGFTGNLNTTHTTGNMADSTGTNKIPPNTDIIPD